MKATLSYMWAKMQCGLNRLKKEELGGSEIIALVVIIGIVLIIAFIFKDAIGNLFVNLWNNFVMGNSTSKTNRGTATGNSKLSW